MAVDPKHVYGGRPRRGAVSLGISWRRMAPDVESVTVWYRTSEGHLIPETLYRPGWARGMRAGRESEETHGGE